jgi:hypothetical protein
MFILLHNMIKGLIFGEIQSQGTWVRHLSDQSLGNPKSGALYNQSFVFYPSCRLDWQTCFQWNYRADLGIAIPRISLRAQYYDSKQMGDLDHNYSATQLSFKSLCSSW